MKVIRRMGPGLQQLAQDGYLRGVLAELEGQRDRYEIEPVLERALRDTPDDNRGKQLGAALDLVRLEPTLEQLQTMASDRTSLTFEPEFCPICCANACIICGWDAHLGVTACLACCVVGCMSCTFF
jgi:hypothetical protein